MRTVKDKSRSRHSRQLSEVARAASLLDSQMQLKASTASLYCVASLLWFVSVLYIFGWEEIGSDRVKKNKSTYRRKWESFALLSGADGIQALHDSVLDPTTNVGLSPARESASMLTPEAFVNGYEATKTPVIVSGYTSGWPAATRWSLGELAQRFPDYKLRAGSGMRRFTFSEYQQYLIDGSDADEPRVIFDSDFVSNIAADYSVPGIFPSNPGQEVGGRGLDLLSYIPRTVVSKATTIDRPDFRWLIIGPRRSGSSLHTDPDGTSAWNTLVSGHKLWVLIPPGAPRGLVMLTDDDLLDDDAQNTKTEDGQVIHDEDDIDDATMDVIDVEGDDKDHGGYTREGKISISEYFVNFVPHLKKTNPDIEVYQFVQNPGETLFVPSGWWHAVLNLDTTVAITQNYCSEANFPEVWRSIRGSKTRRDKRPLRAAAWLDGLHNAQPSIAKLAERLDSLDSPRSGLRR